jgi:hypothetical protein
MKDVSINLIEEWGLSVPCRRVVVIDIFRKGPKQQN